MMVRRMLLLRSLGSWDVGMTKNNWPYALNLESKTSLFFSCTFHPSYQDLDHLTFKVVIQNQSTTWLRSAAGTPVTKTIQIINTDASGRHHGVLLLAMLYNLRTLIIKLSQVITFPTSRQRLRELVYYKGNSIDQGIFLMLSAMAKPRENRTRVNLAKPGDFHELGSRHLLNALVSLLN